MSQQYIQWKPGVGTAYGSLTISSLQLPGKEADRRKQREAEKARRAKAARHSVGFVDGEGDDFNTTFNAGSGDDTGDVPTRNRAGVGSAAGGSHAGSSAANRTLKRKDRGSTGSNGGLVKQITPRRKVLRTSEIFPRHDWPLGMSEAQVNC